MVVQFIDEDIDVFKETDKSFLYTFSDLTTGNPIDISLWGFRFTLFKFNGDDIANAVINDINVIKEDSGSGIVDRAIYSLTNILTDIEAGKYYYFYRITKADLKTYILQKGVMIIKESN